MENNRTALIVIDSGFNRASLSLVASRVLACFDLSTGFKASGAPFVSQPDLDRFAGDDLNHGSIVLTRLAELLPASPVVLVRAYGAERRLIRTTWTGFAADHRGGVIESEGWTEAYLWAVEECKRRGLMSVANLSFGGTLHAVDGSGWEAHQLAKVTGSGKPGHIVVAAAGPGDGRAAHASFAVQPGGRTVVTAWQNDSTLYNLWADSACACGAGSNAGLWSLTVLRDSGQGFTLEEFALDSRRIPANIWNGKQQQQFRIDGEGLVHLVVELDGATTCGGLVCARRYDCWLSGERSAAFLDHVDPFYVVEPAVFPHVLATGLKSGQYAANQTAIGSKPDVLLPGGGAISFRNPEVVAAVATLLNNTSSELDVDSVRDLLGKYPDLGSL